MMMSANFISLFLCNSRFLQVVPLPFETEEDKKVNPYGVGFTTERTVVDKEGFADASPFTSRVFKVINENKINPVSKKPVVS